MFSVEEMNKWRDKVHSLAIEKGWYEEERSRLSLTMLINSEVFEAYECWRKNQDLTYLDSNGKPCGLPSELADIVIRLFDMAGYYGVDFCFPEFQLKQYYGVLKIFSRDDFEKFCSIIAKNMFNWDFIHPEGYVNVISFIYLYCEENNIDLENEMIIKHEYNKTRPRRHGGKRS